MELRHGMKVWSNGDGLYEDCEDNVISIDTIRSAGLCVTMDEEEDANGELYPTSLYLEEPGSSRRVYQA